MIKFIAVFGAIAMLSSAAMAHETCPAIGDDILLPNGAQNGTATYSAEAHFLCEQVNATKALTAEFAKVEKQRDEANAALYWYSWYRPYYYYGYVPKHFRAKRPSAIQRQFRRKPKKELR